MIISHCLWLNVSLWSGHKVRNAQLNWILSHHSWKNAIYSLDPYPRQFTSAIYFQNIKLNQYIYILLIILLWSGHKMAKSYQIAVLNSQIHDNCYLHFSPLSHMFLSKFGHVYYIFEVQDFILSDYQYVLWSGHFCYGRDILVCCATQGNYGISHSWL